MKTATYLAVDLGAESGRVMAGRFSGERITLEEVHRFPNTPVRTPDGLHWDVLGLYREILEGLRRAKAQGGDAPAGVGVDSWAVDYGLLDAGGRLLGLPYHYRDSRTDGVREQVAARIPPLEHYARTGIAPLPFNTIYQLSAQRRAGDRGLDLAGTLLLIPDLLHYWLCGAQATEETNASTTAALDLGGAWADDLLARLDLPSAIFPEVRRAGTVLDALRRDVQTDTGLGAVPVIAPATHDTASAVLAVPARGASHAYISSGTWSLLGLELPRPIATEQALRAGFTNERGVDGTFRFLRNIMGLWLVQECRRAWARAGHDWTYDVLSAQAAAIPSPGVRIDVDDPAFLHPDDMPAAIAAQLARSGQPTLEEPAALVRAILEGLAASYRATLEQAEQLAGTRVDTIHIVGGGARNALLCRLAADTCGRTVLAGPVEATALGNVLAQAMARGEVASVAEARDLVRASVELVSYEPRG
jgi:rhamnulokinase